MAVNPFGKPKLTRADGGQTGQGLGRYVTQGFGIGCGLLLVGVVVVVGYWLLIGVLGR